MAQKSMLQIVKDALRHSRAKWPMVAEKTGVPESTISKIVYEYTKNPGVNHVQALYDYVKRAA